MLVVPTAEAQLRATKSLRPLGAAVFQCKADATPPKCKFDVEVEPDGATGCKLFFDANTIETFRRADGDKNVLVWQLYTLNGVRKQYSFTVDGIDIKPPPGRRDFDQKGHDGGDIRRFKWRSVNEQDGDFRFDIKVVRKVGRTVTPCDQYDPIIVNKG